MPLYICELQHRPAGEPPQPVIWEGNPVTREIVADGPGKARHEWLSSLRECGWEHLTYANIRVRRSGVKQPELFSGWPERLNVANDIIRVIATCGRRFFSSDTDRPSPEESPCVAHFIVDGHNELWFVDSYTRKRVLIRHFDWPQFTNGGTMRRLVEHLAAHIRTGAPINLAYFSPAPGWVCGGDPWGYGEAMKDVAAKVAVLTNGGNTQ